MGAFVTDYTGAFMQVRLVYPPSGASELQLHIVQPLNLPESVDSWRRITQRIDLYRYMNQAVT